MKRYNPQQIRAINASDGYFLVLAPPGCGKTDILAERICVAAEKGVPMADMLCLTFTNRASRGMQERILQRAGGEGNNVFVGNIHRYCSHLLFDSHIISQSTSIIDEDDQHDLFRNVDRDYFVHGNNSTNKAAIKYIDDLATYIRHTMLDHPEHVKPSIPDAPRLFDMARACGFDPKRLPVERKALRYALQYIEYKKRHNIIDFSDILVDAYDYLVKTDGYKQYPWIQVDEVQDLNPLQLAIIDALTAPNSTVMYLGDEQQAIFSFLGSKLSQLNLLKQRCTLITLNQNYRSPQYILDMCNEYAVKQLNVDPAFLPHSHDNTPKSRLDMILTKSPTVDDEFQRIRNMVKYYLDIDADSRLAILVAKNFDADRVSEELSRCHIDNFKVSGFDMFSTASYKALMSVYAVLVNDFNYVAWSRLIYGIGAVESLTESRNIIYRMKELMLTPSDLLSPVSYLQDFYNTMTCREIVVFDTETTGVDVLTDDIVQIAAFKMLNGKKVPGSDFNIIMHTDKHIPEMLGDIPNPLIDEYSRAVKLSRADGLAMFVDYVGDRPLLGHNSRYDYQILRNNLQRTLGIDFTAKVYDTLHIAKCVNPGLKSYKLKDLLLAFYLEGENSHLANDDIEATKSLVDYCVERFKPVLAMQTEYLNDRKTQILKTKVAPLRRILESIRAYIDLPIKSINRSLAQEFRLTYDSLLRQVLIKDLGKKFDTFLNYIDNLWPTDPEQSLYDKISLHINDLTSSINEGDLINSPGLIAERVFIMTVYKAKGLEFDNVIILGAVDGVYPFFKVNQTFASRNATQEEIEQARRDYMEDARKFYVALSRARKRICISYNEATTWGHPKTITPFMAPIYHHFHFGVQSKK